MHRHSSSCRALVLAATTLIVVAGCGGALPARASARLVAHLHAPGHHPKANQKWPIRITAQTPSGKPVQARVRYAFLLGGQVVARRSNYRFRGTFHDNIIWPPSAIGYRLTFRAVVTSSAGNRNLDYWVQVQR